MKLGTTSHPKFQRLRRELNLPIYATVGILESVWMLASQFADNGDLSRFSSQEIADYLGYSGDANTLVETLIACRWLDRSDQTLTIHDWLEHRPSYLNDRDKKREKREKTNVSDVSLGHSEIVQDIPGKSPPNPTQPNPTQPNHAQPNLSPTQPNHAGAGWEERWRDVGGKYVDLVVETANRFMRIKRLTIERELIWQACWIACQFDRDCILDTIERLKTGEIKRPESYLKSIMRKLCLENGETWDKIRVLVPPAPPVERKEL